MCVGEAGGVVDDERSLGDRQLSEQDTGGDRPRPVVEIGGRVAAHHHNVEVVDANALLRAVVTLDAAEVGLQRLVVPPFRRAGVGADRTVGAVGEIADPHQPRLVAHSCRRHRQACGRVLRLLGLDAVDDESDSHAAAPIMSSGVVDVVMPASRAWTAGSAR
jgi:hypothetical protein